MKKTRPRSGSTNRSHKEPRRLMKIPNSKHPNPKKISNLNLGNFVHRDNPLARLTFAQLDALFGAEHRRGQENIRTWDQLGLSGEWSGRPIAIYQGVLDAAPAFYFSIEVMKGSLLWNEHTRVF